MARDYEFPGRPREAVWTGVPGGRLPGDVTLTVLDASTGVIVHGPVAAVLNPASVWAHMYTAPNEEGLYLERWHDTPGSISKDYELEITSSSPQAEIIQPPSGELLYTSYGQLDAYTDARLPAQDKTERILLRAQRDIESYLNWRRGSVTAEMVAEWEPVQRDGMRDAVCAQAEYRLTMGEEFFVQDRAPTQGADFQTEKAPSYIGPQARRELRDSGLLSMTGRLRDRPRQIAERRFF